jgi:hypothetical protein
MGVSRGRLKPALGARLLTCAQAAAYCGLSIAAFAKLCPVRPIALGNDKRLQRYDIVELDKWIDGFRQSDNISRDWLAVMDKVSDKNSG